MIKRLKLRKAFCLVLIISSTNWATDLDSDIELPTTTEDPETRYNVRVVNSSGCKLQLNCNSLRGAFPQQIMDNDESFAFWFDKHIWPDIKYSCRARCWNSSDEHPTLLRQRDFDAYNGEAPKRSNIWMVVDDGINLVHNSKRPFYHWIELVNATTTPPADDSFAMENDTGSASPSDIDISIIDRLTKEESAKH